MKNQFDIEKLIETGKIQNELEFERALIADRKLRVLAKENPKFNSIRKALRDLIQTYEHKNWSSQSRISDKKIKDSDLARNIAENERVFLSTRKQKIKASLKKLSITQQELGVILGHRSKTYMSELMNGISPFTLKDLIIMNQLLGIRLIELIPTMLPYSERLRIKTSLDKLNNPKLKLSTRDLVKA